MSILETLKTDFSFKDICKKNQKKGNMEVVIIRGEPTRAAVKPEFPCSLLNDNELLDIKFIKAGGNSGTVKMRKLTDHTPENLVSFYIRTRGAKNIHKVMKNEKLKGTVDYVCVYAVKGEKVKVALKRDGRFNGVMFSKGALYDQHTDSTVNLSTLVDQLGGKLFHVTVSPHQTGSQESSQEMNQEFETAKDEKSEVPETPQATNSQASTNIPEKKAETPLQEKKSRKYPETKEIPNTQEILNLLRKQHGDLLKTLKEREKLKNNVEVKKFFRKEYDKSAQSFTEVKRVKQLMSLSNSVCQIRSDGSPKGTGFLLFDRFVLTNAHVVGDLVPCTPQMKHKLTAAFMFEDLNNPCINIPLNENVVAFHKGKDDLGNHLDFALLELSSDVKLDLHQLLSCYSRPPTRGGVCIIGHPEGGVKRMDPCFIIAKEDREKAAEEYYEMNQNLEVFHVITQRCLAEDTEIKKSQIIYHSCFFHGSSGSPVFDDHCNLIGVHTGGYVYKRERVRSVMEYALPMFPILLHICMQCHQSERSEIVEHFQSQNNMKLVLQVANEQLQETHQAI